MGAQGSVPWRATCSRVPPGGRGAWTLRELNKLRFPHSRKIILRWATEARAWRSEARPLSQTGALECLSLQSESQGAKPEKRSCSPGVAVTKDTEKNGDLTEGNRSVATWGGEGLQGPQRNFWGVTDVLIINGDASQCIHMSKHTKLHTFKMSGLKNKIK